MVSTQTLVLLLNIVAVLSKPEFCYEGVLFVLTPISRPSLICLYGFFFVGYCFQPKEMLYIRIKF